MKTRKTLYLCIEAKGTRLRRKPPFRGKGDTRFRRGDVKKRKHAGGGGGGGGGGGKKKGGSSADTE